jgi:glutamine synthetase
VILLPSSRESVIRAIREKQIRLLSVEYVDFGGISRSKARTVGDLEGFLESGVGFAKANFGITAFDTVAAEPTYTVASGEANLVPDVETFAIPPYANRVARFMGELRNIDGSSWELCPRHAFRDFLKRVEMMGYKYWGGAEMEFNVVRREGSSITPWISAAIQSQHGLELGEELVSEIVENVEAMNVKVIKAHAEGGGTYGGHFEIDMHHQTGVKCADDVVTFRDAAKAISHKRGLEATFLAKLADPFTGSGMHMHSSLTDPRADKNLFVDPNDDRKLGLSQLCYHFIGGILEHTRGLCAAVAANVNSYKRLIHPGHWAADGVFYASGHRGAAVRIPQVADKNETAHVEFRVPDPACNPYIAFTCMLAAGIDGIKRKIEPGDPITDDVGRLSRNERSRRGIKPLPKSLYEAVEEFRKDDVFRDALGKALFDEYANIKLAEWDEYSALVTPWETERMINYH